MSPCAVFPRRHVVAGPGHPHALTHARARTHTRTPTTHPTPLCFYLRPPALTMASSFCGVSSSVAEALLARGTATGWLLPAPVPSDASDTAEDTLGAVGGRCGGAAAAASAALASGGLAAAYASAELLAGRISTDVGLGLFWAGGAAA